jgi:hypothetical protein
MLPLLGLTVAGYIIFPEHPNTNSLGLRLLHQVIGLYSEYGNHEANLSAQGPRGARQQAGDARPPETQDIETFYL